MQRNDETNIRQLNDIVERMRAYLDIKKEDNDENYQNRNKNFLKLKECLDNKNYEGAKACIEEGLVQFKQIVFTSRYFEFLEELKKNLVPENKNDLTRRFKKIISAIHADNHSKISDALQRGCLPLINEPIPSIPSSGIKFGSLLLDVAIKNDKVNAFKTLLAEGAQCSDVNKAFHFAVEHGLARIIESLVKENNIDVNVQDDKGQTALWLLCSNPQNLPVAELNFQIMKLLRMGADPNLKPNPKSLSCLELMLNQKNYGAIKFLNGKGASLDVPNAKGDFPLWLAVKNNDTSHALELLKLGADPNLKSNQHRTSCLGWAIYNQNFELVSALLRANMKVTSADYELAKKYKATEEGGKVFDFLYQRVKVPLKKYKKQIIEQSSQHSFFPSKNASNDTDYGKSKSKIFRSTLDNPVNGIMEQLHVEDEITKHNFQKTLSILANHKHTILQPLLKIVALGSVGIRSENNVKPLKTVLDSQSRTVENLSIEGNRAEGRYTLKSSVYVGSKSDSSATTLHEWKHFTDKEVFGNALMPLSASDEALYEKVVEQIKQNIHQLPEDNNVLKNIKWSFKSVFTYSSEQINCELLARVPEVIGALGMEKGYEWLQENTPSLLDFYENNYNKYLEAHLLELEKKFKTESLSTPDTPEAPRPSATK